MLRGWAWPWGRGSQAELWSGVIEGMVPAAACLFQQSRSFCIHFFGRWVGGGGNKVYLFI